MSEDPTQADPMWPFPLRKPEAGSSPFPITRFRGRLLLAIPPGGPRSSRLDPHSSPFDPQFCPHSVPTPRAPDPLRSPPRLNISAEGHNPLSADLWQYGGVPCKSVAACLRSPILNRRKTKSKRKLSFCYSRCTKFARSGLIARSPCGLKTCSLPTAPFMSEPAS